MALAKIQIPTRLSLGHDQEMFKLKEISQLLHLVW
jgi:hypothetical protein